MKLRVAQKEDIQDILELEFMNFSDPWTYKMLYYDIEINPNAKFFVIVNELDKLCAYVGIWLLVDNVDITTISVDPSYKRQGLGFKLLNQVEIEAKEHKLEKISLEVNVNNTIAIAMYEKYGFIKIRRIKNYYSKLKEDAFLMQKEVFYE